MTDEAPKEERWEEVEDEIDLSDNQWRILSMTKPSGEPLKASVLVVPTHK